MTARSLAVITDLMLARRSGEVVEHGDHTVVRTAAEPTYWLGNSIVVAPTPADLDQWTSAFAAAHPGAAHCAIVVDGELAPEVAAEAADRGFDVRRQLALTATALAAAPIPEGIEVRPLAGDIDWDAQLLLTLGCDELEAPRDDRYRAFVADRQREKRRWTEAGHGTWWGAFADRALIASLGLFAGEGLGRRRGAAISARRLRAARRRHRAAALGAVIVSARSRVTGRRCRTAARSPRLRRGAAGSASSTRTGT